MVKFVTLRNLQSIDDKMGLIKINRSKNELDKHMVHAINPKKFHSIIKLNGIFPYNILVDMNIQTNYAWQ